MIVYTVVCNYKSEKEEMARAGDATSAVMAVTSFSDAQAIVWILA